MTEHHAQGPIDEIDPHGFHQGGHHGHVIIPMRVLAGVLGALLVFTVLTVAASRAEIWASAAFGLHIPHLVNVLVALSIAVVKSILVAMFFMQLKYDNPLNSLVFLFCLFAFALFLFFPLLDLGSRDVIYSYKAGEKLAGGTGGPKRTVHNEKGEPVEEVVTGPIVTFAREKRLATIAGHMGSIADAYLADGWHGVESLPAPRGVSPAHWAEFQAEFRHAAEAMAKAGELTDPAGQKDLLIGRARDAKYEAEAAAAHGHKAHHEPRLQDRTISSRRAATGVTPNLFDAAPAGPAPGHGAGH